MEKMTKKYQKAAGNPLGSVIVFITFTLQGKTNGFFDFL